MKGMRSWFSGSFIRDVAKLAAGTLAGRLIALAALPLITRIYSPEDFTLLAIYLSLVSTIAVAACLRLEIAIPLADTDSDAAALLILAFMALVGVVLIVSVPVLQAPDQIATWLGNPKIAPYLWLVPLGIAFAGSYSVLQLWATRARRFGTIARTRVSQSVTGVSTMLALGWAGAGPFGLLLGNMLNISAGGFYLAISAWRSDKTNLRAVRLSRLGHALHRYRRFPVFSTPEALINIAGIQIPILLIAAHSGAEAGFLLLAMQVMTAPMTLLGSSISQVYMSRAPEEMREGRLAPFTLSIMRRLALVGVGPLIVLGALSPIVFPWIFGVEWTRAGEIVTWLVPWMALQFIASPVSMVMHITNRQHQLLAIRLVALLIRVGTILLASQLFQGKFLIIAFSLSNSIVYMGMAIMFISAAKSGNLAERN